MSKDTSDTQGNTPGGPGKSAATSGQQQDLLAHALGVAGERRVAVFPEAHQVKQLVHLRLQHPAGQGAQAVHQLKILAAAKVRIEVRLLGDVADPALKGLQILAGSGEGKSVTRAQKTPFPAVGSAPPCVRAGRIRARRREADYTAPVSSRVDLGCAGATADDSDHRTRRRRVRAMVP